MKHTTTVIHPFQQRSIDLSGALASPPPRLSLRGVLWVKFLRWIEQSPSTSLLALSMKCSMLALALLAVLAPSLMLRILWAAYEWNGHRIPLCLGTIALTASAPRCFRFVRAYSARRRKSRANGSAPTYEGIPCDELTTYLFEHQTFGTDAMNDLALAQRKWRRIADQLETNAVLVRGENNARVLNPAIDRATLTRQLRDGFPLVWDPIGKTWAERRGSFDTWTLAKDRAEAKEKARIEKLARKEKKLRAKIDHLKEQGTIGALTY